ncbi:MAG: hypothetical protein CL819_09055 [Croceicoccus sp.]|nr:hypothetical protein [Croceicoccus sp.]
MKPREAQQARLDGTLLVYSDRGSAPDLIVTIWRWVPGESDDPEEARRIQRFARGNRGKLIVVEVETGHFYATVARCLTPATAHDLLVSA